MQRLCHDGEMIHCLTMTQATTLATHTHSPQNPQIVPTVLNMAWACTDAHTTHSNPEQRAPQIQALNLVLDWRPCAQAPRCSVPGRLPSAKHTDCPCTKSKQHNNCVWNCQRCSMVSEQSAKAAPAAYHRQPL